MPHVPPPTPWKSLSEPEPDREYLVVLTHLPVGRLSKLPRFLRYTRKIQKQLDAAPDGLVGYSLLAKPLSSKYWTLSVWRDREALLGFIRELPHSEAMAELPRIFSGFKTDRWTVIGRELPPDWDDGAVRSRY